MLHDIAETVISKSLPELNRSARRYIEVSFVRMLAENDLGRDRFRNMRQVIWSGQHNEVPNAMDISLATYLTMDIREYLLIGRYRQSDPTKLTVAETRMREGMSELLRKGIRYANWMDRHGLQRLT